MNEIEPHDPQFTDADQLRQYKEAPDRFELFHRATMQSLCNNGVPKDIANHFSEYYVKRAREFYEKSPSLGLDYMFTILQIANGKDGKSR